jgi:hypothetical protein
LQGYKFVPFFQILVNDKFNLRYQSNRKSSPSYRHNYHRSLIIRHRLNYMKIFILLMPGYVLFLQISILTVENFITSLTEDPYSSNL